MSLSRIALLTAGAVVAGLIGTNGVSLNPHYGMALSDTGLALAGVTVDVWLTDPRNAADDGDFEKLRRPALALSGQAESLIGGRSVATLFINDSVSHQAIDGFGGSLTDSSAWLIASTASRAEIMRRLFDPAQGIGISLLRVPIGASDYTHGPAYTYDDQPAGRTDPTLAGFSIAHDEAYIIPELRQAVGINGRLQIMASPWSPPAWMKDPPPGSSVPSLAGGRLNLDSGPVYAGYFLKFLRAYQASGVHIFAVTPQNEPTGGLQDGPWMTMDKLTQRAFVRDHLGPALEATAGILISDDIVDTTSSQDSLTDYASVMLNDPFTARYIAGIAAHCYNKGLERLSLLPSPAWVTECSGGLGKYGGRSVDAIIDGVNAGARGVLLWNLALDIKNGPIPAAPYGCNFPPAVCNPLVRLKPDGAASYLPDYYELGHFSKFVLPGATRIGSSVVGKLSSTKQAAFKNPDGSIVVVLDNGARHPQQTRVSWKGRNFEYTLPALGVATFRWQGEPASQAGTSPSIP